ncbi:alpha/beta hydrolase family protein [Fodinicurvata fenggangensis]|uniref:alpha/beta hydrolase family protein n=1 Tax=Fodinicurvata fenggangensis TaxID=1121830 RepID=UPI00068A3BC8|nr:dienelactone hydrolase family protein [Fodinicurvata fenggangensis]
MRKRREAIFPALTGLVLSFFLLFPIPESHAINGAQVVNGMGSFKVEGRNVRIDMALPEGARSDAPVPAVAVLHGASGLGSGTLFYPIVEQLVNEGIAAFIVHYFDGLSVANKSSPAYFQQRDRVVGEALEYIAKLPKVDAERIGVYGFSLGAFQALGRATQDERIKAVVAVGGGLSWDIDRSRIESMPPTLILHGARDSVVPVGRAHEAAKVLKTVGANYELQIYDGQAHTLRGSTFDDSLRRTSNFFLRTLKFR